MILILIIIIVFLGTLLIKPNWILPFAWIVLLCYPQQLLYESLPFNAGFDDIFIIMASLAICIRYWNRYAIRRSRTLLLIIFGLYIMQGVSELIGLIQFPDLAIVTIKSSLKGLVLILFVVALVLDIKREKGIQRHLILMITAITIAYMIVIISYFVPAASSLWEVRSSDTRYSLTMASNRTFGPFNGPAEAGGFACIAVPLVIGSLLYFWKKRQIRTLMIVSTTIIVTATVIISKSRSAIIALGLMLAAAIIITRKRWYIIALGLALFSIISYFLYKDVLSIDPVTERFSSIIFNEGFTTRVDIWKIVMQHPPKYLFFGPGSGAFYYEVGVSPHNGYLDMFYCWGLFGVIMFSLLGYYCLKWSKWVMKNGKSSSAAGAAWGLYWGVIALAIASITTDPWYMELLRVLLFGLLVIVHHCYSPAKTIVSGYKGQLK